MTQVLEIQGQARLAGVMEIAGAKNSALKLIAASLLSAHPVKLSNVPHLSDVTIISQILERLGANIEMHHPRPGQRPQMMEINANRIHGREAAYDLVSKMRASILVMGPLLSRFGEAKIAMPGGCSIGQRPINLHIMALEKMGAVFNFDHGAMVVTAPKGLRGVEIDFPLVSVGATEQTIMAATLAKGTTVIRNAACEPEIVDLCTMLTKMGAKIKGAGTSEVVIEGVAALGGVEHAVIPDRIETGSLMCTALMTNSRIELRHTSLDLLPGFDDLMRRAGAKLTPTAQGFIVERDSPHIEAVDMTTSPYPGIATDLQAQWMGMMTQAHGESKITETVFENRFMHVPELMRMGANIIVQDRSAIVKGPTPLMGTTVAATDLRAAITMVNAGLCATGTTILTHLHHLDRGYELIEEKLSRVGATIQRRMVLAA